MALNVSINPGLDSKSLDSLERLRRLAGHEDHGHALEHAAVLTAELLHHREHKRHIQILHQSIRHDRLGMPIMPGVILSDIRHEPVGIHTPETKVPLGLHGFLALDKISTHLKTRNMNEIVRFIIGFSEAIANDLHDGSGVKRLIVVDPAQNNRITVIPTPYDRSLRNCFSRALFSAKQCLSALSLSKNGPSPPRNGPNP